MPEAADHRDGELALRVGAEIVAILDWSLDRGDQSLIALYEQAKRMQWNGSVDIDWRMPVDFGALLPVGSEFAVATFRASPIADRGRPCWDAFRWQVQAWMVCQFLHSEQAALVASARLAEVVPDADAKFCAISQAGDEARHTEVFGRYVRMHVADPYPVNEALRSVFQDALGARDWDFVALAIQCLVEPVALAGFRLAGTTFHDPLIKQIVAKVARDEARHVSFGTVLLRDVIPQMASAELADREEYVLTAVELLRRRFLLADVWERMDVDVQVGTAFAARDPGLSAYRQALFSRVVPMLANIGLLTPRVVDGLSGLDLLDGAARRVIERQTQGRLTSRSRLIR